MSRNKIKSLLKQERDLFMQRFTMCKEHLQKCADIYVQRHPESTVWISFADDEGQYIGFHVAINNSDHKHWYACLEDAFRHKWGLGLNLCFFKKNEGFTSERDYSFISQHTHAFTEYK